MPIRESELAAASVATPAANKQWLFLDTDGIWKTKDEVGTVTIFGASASPLTTKGDLWVFSTTNARLAKPTDGYIWKADSTQATGWLAYNFDGFVSATAASLIALQNPTYYVTALTATLNNEVVLAGTAGRIALTAGVLDLIATAVTPASYGSASAVATFTVDAYGRLTAAANSNIQTLVGDSGAGGTKGFAPAPASGDAAAGKFLKADGTWAVPSSSAAKTFIVAVSDETTAITTGTAKVTFRMPYAMTLTGVRSNVNTASTSGIPTVDINITPAGSPSLPISILSTKLTIDAGELTSLTAAVAAVISNSALSDDDEITIDIDVAGTGAKGLKVTFIGT